MATIKARKQANGTIRYTAIVRRRVGKMIVHREAKAFTYRSATVSWARHREVELEDPATLATASALINHVRARRADGTGCATVMNDLIWIGVVLRAAKNVKEIPVRPEIAQEARGACGELRLISKSRKRSRRPTADELARLRQHLRRRTPVQLFQTHIVGVTVR
ncbi:MAG: hypothetical protein WBE92_18470 [Steroidobacteraceae bacterium]